MDDTQRPADAGGNSDDHYQPWLRNGDDTPSRAAGQRPAPLPTRPKVVIEHADDPAPPMRSAHLSADELLARPIPISASAPGALGLIDRASQAVADGTTAARTAWQQGGIGDAIARLELGRRSEQSAAALASAARAALIWTGKASRQAGEAIGPVLAKASQATGIGLKRIGSEIAESSRRLGSSARHATGSALDALATRSASPKAQPESQIDRLFANGDDEAPPAPAPDATALPLFSANDAPDSAQPPARKGRKPAAAAPAAAIPPADVSMNGGDDRSAFPQQLSRGSRPDGPARAWLRHPATLALGGACLVSSGFAAGLYWTGPGVDRATTERVIHDYLLNNPEILPQAMERLQANQAAVAVNRLRSRIETPFSGAWAGAADGDVVLTIFTDYACTFCRASLADVERLLAEDRRLKVVFRELPILSRDSEPAARLALAAARRGRYMAMHRALFVARTPDAAARTAAADSLGIATGSAVTGAAQITQELEGNIALARELGFDGTPSWVVGDRMLTGAVGYEQLKAAVAAARAG